MPKRIGIWGFGIVGKSALRFFRSGTYGNNHAIAIFDERSLTPEEQALIKEHNATQYTSRDTFLAECDQILVSPGIDLRPYEHIAHKCIAELDLFTHYFKKPTIAITGTVGKTTIAALLSNILSAIDQKSPYSGKVACIGNVGIGMLEILDSQDSYDAAVVELSSFQLTNQDSFAPNLAIWTNIYPNHLDRHGTMDDYFDAKYNICAHQSSDAHAIISYEVCTNPRFASLSKNLKSKLWVSAKEPLNSQQKEQLPLGCHIIYPHQGTIWLTGRDEDKPKALITHDLLPTVGYRENLQYIVTALFALGIDVPGAVEHIRAHPAILTSNKDEVSAHRLELFASIEGVDFYNDSKATIIEATQAAITKLSEYNRPIILILGGISKGVDRSSLIPFIEKHQQIKHIVSFGKEPLEIGTYVATLEEAVRTVMKYAVTGDQVLFSPSGASFDLFKNYRHRGDVFKSLVRECNESGSNTFF